MGVVEDGVLVKVCQRCYLQYPQPGGPTYRAGTVLRLPAAKAKRLSSPPDGSKPTVTLVSETNNGGLEL